MKIDKAIWTLTSGNNQNNIKEYHDKNGVKLALNHIGFDENLFNRLKHERLVREYYRDSFAIQGIGIVQCDVIDISGNKCVKTIGKKIQQGQPGLYIASLAIPLKEQSYVYSLYSMEIGVTGMRDSAILMQLMNNGQEFDPDPETGKIEGWAQDPYFPEYEGPCLKNLSESEEYDKIFPEHPLSKVRFRINELEKFLSNQKIEYLSKKPWWMFW